MPDSFVDHYRNAAPAPELLNAAKLERLLERYTGAMTRLPALKDGTLANRRNFDYLEKRDVLEGLAAYASLGAPTPNAWRRCTRQAPRNHSDGN